MLLVLIPFILLSLKVGLLHKPATLLTFFAWLIIKGVCRIEDRGAHPPIEQVLLHNGRVLHLGDGLTACVQCILSLLRRRRLNHGAEIVRCLRWLWACLVLALIAFVESLLEALLRHDTVSL